MDLASHPSLTQIRQQRIALRRPHHIVQPGRPSPRLDRVRAYRNAPPNKLGCVGGSVLGTFLTVPFEPVELNAPDRGKAFAQRVVETQRRDLRPVLVTWGPTVTPKLPHAQRPLRVVGEGHASLPGDVNTLAGETGEANVSDGAEFSATVGTTERVSGIFDNIDAALSGQIHNGVHIDGVAVIMKYDDRLGLLGENRFDGAQIDVAGRLEHVGVDRSGSHLEGTLGQRHIAVGRHHDVVSWSKPKRKHSEVQRGRPRGDADTVGHPKICCHLLLKGFDLRTVVVDGARRRSQQRRRQFIVERCPSHLVSDFAFSHAYLHHQPCSASFRLSPALWP